MKRIIAICLCMFLLCGTAFAATNEPPEQAESDRLEWDSLNQRIRNNSLNVLALEENIDSIEAIDYDRMYEDLRSQLNKIASAQWAMITAGMSSEAEKLDQSYDALRVTFDSIRDGDMQEDNADAVWQLNSTISQIVAAGQTLYINLLSMEQSEQDAQRALTALDRNLEEQKLRNKLGQVSQQSVTDLEQTRIDMMSQIETLQHNITTYKAQLQLMIGEEPTGELNLGPLPKVTAEEITALDYESDLAAAKSVSWTLRSAEAALEDAREERKDSYSSVKYKEEMSLHTWNAAQFTYQSSVQEFENSFQNLYRSLDDLQQIYENKFSAVANQERQLKIAKLKYDLGQISRSDLIAAQDNMENASSEAQTAELNLFAALNQYHTAVEYGILN